MKLRYVKEGGLFYPQYFGKDDKWHFFQDADLHIDSKLLRGIQGFMNYINQNVRSREHLFTSKNDKKVLCFVDEFTTYAFLGAATYWFNVEKIELNFKFE